MQGTALWKRILILIICGWGIAAAVPNLFYAQVERHNLSLIHISEPTRPY